MASTRSGNTQALTSQSTSPTPSAAPTSVTSQGPAPSDSSSGTAAAAPISLPKGGGAIRSIGEKFDVNANTGTGSLTVPISLSSSRAHTPHLSLNYSPGYGNSPFGIGWTLSDLAVTRKTEKGLPRYFDNDDQQADVFVAGGEDLVPIYKKDKKGNPILLNGQLQYVNATKHPGYEVRTYMHRVEQRFSRIERWTDSHDPRQIHWRKITSDNTTFIYGSDERSRIYDSSSESPRIFSWLLRESYDDKGNAAVYNYKQEDSVGVPTDSPSEQNRQAYYNRYIKSIRYGNRQPNRDLTTWTAFSPSQLPDKTWMFSVIFDYGEHDATHPTPSDPGNWACRLDPFSSYRATFEIRTYRLCQRILMFHHFPDQLGQQDVLISSMDFTYDSRPMSTYLVSIADTGYLLDSTGKRYHSRSLPPLELTYSQFPTDAQISKFSPQSFDPQALRNVPAGVDGSRFQWIDLDGEGLAGIFSQSVGGAYYKHNLSVEADDKKPCVPQFGTLDMLRSFPSAKKGEMTLVDLSGDGQLDIVSTAIGLSGFYARLNNGWSSFKPFASFPNIDFNNPYLRFLDLTGNGLSDIIIFGDQVFTWYQSAGNKGFLPASKTPKPLSDRAGPRVVFQDAKEQIYFADMTGDGLSDIVRIRNQSVDYWPNLGYGRFGGIVRMGNAPIFAAFSELNYKYILLADVDGSGTTDILYLKSGGVDMYLNQSGNNFSAAKQLSVFPPIDNMSKVDAIDLFGNGTTCLVWSSPGPGANPSMKYIDLTMGIKPHLLIKRDNNLGSVSHIHYAPSTKFYLQDKLAGNPWITRLAFPVQCVEKLEIHEKVTQSIFVTRYAYHHGYFDGMEREFRGFAMVEKWDTEAFDVMKSNSPFASPKNLVSSMHATPIYTKTWYHTGLFIDRQKISQFLAHEYFGADDPSKPYLGTLLPDSVLPDNVSGVPGISDACRALCSTLLRQETYGLDRSSLASTPFTVTENNYTIVAAQPLPDNWGHSIFRVHGRESISCNFERNPDDPRVRHNMIIEVDQFGNILKSLDVAYGREPGKSTLDPEPRAVQETSHILYEQNTFTNSVSTADDYYLPAQASSTQSQIYGFGQAGRLQYDQFTSRFLDSIPSLPFEAGPHITTRAKRIVKQSATKYRSNDLTQLLDVGTIESLALPGQSYQLAFTPGLFRSVAGQTPQTAMEDLIPDLENTFKGTGPSQGGYMHLDSDTNWWKPSDLTFYDPRNNITAAQELVTARSQFFQPRKSTDPFRNNSYTEYDNHALLPRQMTNAVGDVTTISNNYVVLKPYLMTDPNGNRQQVAFDELGRVVGDAVMGKSTENLGDSLQDFQNVLSQAHVDAFYANPQSLAVTLLRNATSRTIYDVELKDGRPRFTATITRQYHVSDHKPQVNVNITFAYYDGLSRMVQMKTQAEPGYLADSDSGPVIKNRWVVSGWIVYNNKGNPIKEFEPFFDDTHTYKGDQMVGVASIVLYDAIDRQVVNILPNHTWSTTIIQAWEQKQYDVNDNVLDDNPTTNNYVGGLFKLLPQSDYLPTWYNARINGGLGKDEQQAAVKTAAHANTPSCSHYDPDGRIIVSVQTTGSQQFKTTLTFDILGRTLTVIDAKNRLIQVTDYDLLGNAIHQASMEAGRRWILTDSTENQIYRWDSRLQRFRMTYDQLRRPEKRFFMGLGTENLEFEIDRNVWGTMPSNGQKNNQCGKLVEGYDQAGVITNTLYDFKGNLIETQRQLATNYKGVLDWSNPVDLERDIYKKTMLYDAFNRTTFVTTPDQSVTQYIYNARSLVSQILCILRGQKDEGNSGWTTFATNLTYNANSQRTYIKYGNGVTTTSTYDPVSFRLAQTITRRSSETLQNLSYVYDPVGNITHLQDDAQQKIYFRNHAVTPSCDYTYDPLYQLTVATGREKLGQLNGKYLPVPGESTRVVSPSDGKAMGSYTESYSYDPVGNILSLQHAGTDPVNPGWTRTYYYQETSQLQSREFNNRLSHTITGSILQTYGYEGLGGVHGDMTSMPQLSMIEWNYNDQIGASARQVISKGGTPEITYYIYDSQGIRVRKVTERSADVSRTPTRMRERIYLGGYEVFRKYASDGTTINLERQTLSISNDKTACALVEYRRIGSETKTPQQLIRYQFVNPLASVSLELDSTAKIISYEEYTPFGETSYQAYDSQTELPKRYRYTGKERDEDTGLYYMTARYYIPGLGRWTSCDPIGLGDGPNVYAYVRNNPIDSADPTGTGNGESKEPALPAGQSRRSKPRATGRAPRLNISSEQSQPRQRPRRIQTFPTAAGSYTTHTLNDSRKRKIDVAFNPVNELTSTEEKRYERATLEQSALDALMTSREWGPTSFEGPRVSKILIRGRDHRGRADIPSSDPVQHMTVTGFDSSGQFVGTKHWREGEDYDLPSSLIPM